MCEDKECTSFLRVVVERALHVPANSSAVTSLRNPYLHLQLGKILKQTTVAQRTLQPMWREKVELPMVDDGSNILVVTLWDHCVLQSDERLGQFTIDLHSYKNSSTTKAPKLQTFRCPLDKHRAIDGNEECVVVLGLSLTTFSASEFSARVWENQRWAPATGSWSSAHLTSMFADRKPFSSATHGGLRFTDALPVVPSGYKAREPWGYYVTCADTNGWRYATSFEGPWHATMTKTHVVRCREWVNTYESNSPQ
ncbi:hypothetical protein ACHHYP_12554 [Achlya hypogyna]|uniref:C2 domain-containing protein n=1 Tax=Achlya hypogyna TaxID=1202772 RepID=A0A1V9YGV6_ACHHY|nr:hypothetical protein ACHHYP_12554 [Achlya hypogyna]